MARPAIITVDDDAPVSAAIARDLRARYGAEHRILRASSGPEALDLVARLVLRGQPLALVASDQRMPSMTGIELLSRVRADVPDAKLLLLTAYADTDVAISAINEIGLDHYLLKPWDPPEERLYPVWTTSSRTGTTPIPSRATTSASSATGGPRAATSSRPS
ncbi:hypothetical protein GCM10009721_35380 [Terrabacter tumescens]|uniref:Response regulatory domain-containing protein n=1 Tax=Terrabacter tumescens TaxID=60443 RepID=A0ABQ2ID84_9MICO|nr:response regulator [Terrabacter tumescens]GGN04846.1 hypothetical protein GCM10009721_35380 [Terrabacter tumescens]